MERPRTPPKQKETPKGRVPEYREFLQVNGAEIKIGGALKKSAETKNLLALEKK